MKLRILPVRPATVATEGRAMEMNFSVLIFLEADFPADEEMLADFAETELIQ